jgi:predicted RND superfamily exporter protein
MINPARKNVSTSSWLERWLFTNRRLIVLLCGMLTLLLAYSTRDVTLNAAFSSRIPVNHPFIQNFIHHEEDLKSGGNTLKIVVSTTGSVLDLSYLQTLSAINDEVFLLPGVDRPYMRSLWTPSVRWLAVTEQGFAGGPVMPDHFDGGAESNAALQANLLRSGEIGQLVAQDFKSSVLVVPLLERDATTGAALDYGALSRRLDTIRTKYESPTIGIHIVGFAKVMGDLIGGLHQILWFFALSVLIATGAVYWFTRCVRSTTLVVTCSLVAVIWQIGLLPLLGFGLDPYSILVPFLIFAIGMSHGAQKMNGVMQDIGRGLPSLEAARMTFRRLFVAGLTALICDAVGFAVLLVIDIQAIQSLALIASLGVAILVITNLILLPILLSYVGVDAAAAARAVRGGEKVPRLWCWLTSLTQPRAAIFVLAAACVVAAGSWWIGTGLKVGDLEPGAPELRKTSQYNVDDAYLTSHYGAGSDQIVVLVTTPEGQCADYPTLSAIDRLEWELQTLQGVESTSSGADLARHMIPAFNEGNLKWAEILPNAGTLHYLIPNAPREVFSHACNLTPLTIHLSDHKADTLERVITHVQQYATQHASDGEQFLLAAGNGGIEAATNAVVARASDRMLIYVYAAVILLSLITFRSWRGVLVAVIPLVLTSLAAQALMVLLGIGLKVATLPVTALGVGIGVDYALYTLSVTLAAMRSGQSLSEAYLGALQFTGRVVMLTGFTLAAAVMTWAFSPIKFQADMGILLSFMFIVNMVGALVLLPALACFLLRPAALPAPIQANAHDQKIAQTIGSPRSAHL